MSLCFSLDSNSITLKNCKPTDKTNSFSGYLAGSSNADPTIVNNSAFGAQSLQSNLTGTDNTAIGFQALQLNTALANTAVGSSNSSVNVTGSNNTSIGYDGLGYNVTGSGNTSIGTSSLATNVTASNNTAVGSDTDIASDAVHNSSTIGYYAIAADSNLIQLGNPYVNTIVSSATAVSTIADSTLNRTVDYAGVPGLKFITLLKPVTYTTNQEATNAALGFTISPQDVNSELIVNGLKTGFVGQDVMFAAQSIDYEFNGLTISSVTPVPGSSTEVTGGIHALSYAQFVPSLVQAIIEQQAMIVALRTDVDKLKK